MNFGVGHDIYLSSQIGTETASPASYPPVQGSAYRRPRAHLVQMPSDLVPYSGPLLCSWQRQSAVSLFERSPVKRVSSCVFARTLVGRAYCRGWNRGRFKSAWILFMRRLPKCKMGFSFSSSVVSSVSLGVPFFIFSISLFLCIRIFCFYNLIVGQYDIALAAFFCL